jgi:hypothetical protein
MELEALSLDRRGKRVVLYRDARAEVIAIPWIGDEARARRRVITSSTMWDASFDQRNRRSGIARAWVVAFIAAVVSSTWSFDARAATTLVVQVVTDLTPGLQLAAVRATVEAADECGNTRHVRITPGAGQSWSLGVRVADISRLRDGTVRVTVEALDPSGNVIVERPVRVDLTGGVKVATVLLSGPSPCGSNCPAAPADPAVLG